MRTLSQTTTAQQITRTRQAGLDFTISRIAICNAALAAMHASPSPQTHRLQAESLTAVRHTVTHAHTRAKSTNARPSPPTNGPNERTCAFGHDLPRGSSERSNQLRLLRMPQCNLLSGTSESI